MPPLQNHQLEMGCRIVKWEDRSEIDDLCDSIMIKLVTEARFVGLPLNDYLKLRSDILEKDHARSQKS